MMLMAKRATFSTRLREAREARGLSTRELDAAAKVAIGRTWQIESGRKANVEVKTIARIASALGCSIDWLVSGVGDGPHVDAS